MSVRPALERHMVTGTYTGSGGAGQSITGIGFHPRFLMVWEQKGSGYAIKVWMKNDADAANISVIFWDELLGAAPYYPIQPWSDMITSLDADGFTVGNNPPRTPNTNLQVYVYVAWR